MRYLILLLLLSSCQSLSFQSITDLFSGSSDKYYKKDLKFVVNKQQFEGIAIVPHSARYEIAINTDNDYDLFTASTCHRELDVRNIDVQRSRKWFRMIEKRYISFTYLPDPNLEFGKNNRFCPLTLGLYNKNTGQEYWGFVDFKTIYERLKANMYCNGERERIEGVGICQTRAGLKQMLTFGEDYEIYSECLEGKIKGKNFIYYTPEEDCVSLFVGKDSGNFLRFTTFGYNRIKMKDFTLD